jgi:hypothetical protein
MGQSRPPAFPTERDKRIKELEAEITPLLAYRIAGEESGMKSANQQSGTEPGISPSARLGLGSWTILIVLVLLLAVTFAIVYLGWTLASGTDVPASGYVAMAFGVIVSLGVGFGLMALIFYSSRKGYDEPPVLLPPDGDESDAASANKNDH